MELRPGYKARPMMHVNCVYLLVYTYKHLLVEFIFYHTFTEMSLMVQEEKCSPLLEHKTLIAALPVSIAEMQRSFGKVVTNTMKSLESTVTTKQFALSLIALGAYEPVTKKEQSLLDDHEDEIFEAETILNIYRIIRPYMSFFNPELLAYVIETHGTQVNRDDFKEYMSKLNTFCQSIVVPPMKFSSEESSLYIERREEVRIKLNMSDRRLQCLRDIKSSIATILGVKKAVLYINSVEEGSIEVIFLVPQFVIQHLFPLSDVQVEAISSQIGTFKLTIPGRYLWVLEPQCLAISIMMNQHAPTTYVCVHVGGGGGRGD